MADKRDGQAQSQAQVKIGHYILGDTLGVGTFGKVKSKLQNVFALIVIAWQGPFGAFAAV